jgi:hypothetical protein
VSQVNGPRPELNVPQAEFLLLPHKYKGFVAGFGSGKTWVGCAAQCKHSWEWPGVNAGYFAPTFGHIRDIFYPTMEEVAFDWGLKTKVHFANKEVDIYSGKTYRNTIICRSLEDPEKIVGFKIGHAQVDELDLLKKEKAAIAWRKIIARMRENRPGLRNGIDVTTTPEGFKFVYEQFVSQVREKPDLKVLYGLVQASTHDNAKNLPADYIPSLRASYPPQLIDAYLKGQFTNLASGSVYVNFDRKLNHTSATIAEREPLHIGMDFNVLNMTATVNVIRNDLPMQLDELVKVRDTPAMGRMIKERYVDKGHHVTIYPDASGQNTSSKNASESDFSILRQYQLKIDVASVNPTVRDRVNAFNALILNDVGERKFLINTNRCPVTTEALEQQAWDKDGEPDKKTGHDHPVDAEGYFLVRKFPIVRTSARRVQVGGGL